MPSRHVSLLKSTLAGTATWAVALAFFSVSAMQVLLGLAFLAWIALRARRPRSEAAGWLIPAGIWIATGVLATILAQDTGRATRDLGSLLTVLLPLVLADALPSRRALTRAERSWIVAAGIAALIGWAQFAANGPAFRASGTVGHYMTFAGLMLLASQFLLAGVLFGPPRGRLLRCLVLVLVAGALFATHTRSAWLGFFGGSALLFLIRAPRWSALLPLVAVVLYLAAPAPLQERVRSFADRADTTATERVYLWGAGLAMAREHPLTGIGPRNVEQEYSTYQLPDDPWLPWRRLTHLHSNPVHILAERGALGLLAFLLLAGWGLARAVTCLRSVPREDSFLRGLAAGALAAQVAFHLAGFFEYSFGDDEVATLYWLAVALPFALPAAQTTEEAPTPVLRWKILLATTAGLLVFGEAWARSQSRADEEGNIRIGSRALRPRALPIEAVTQAANARTVDSYLVHDTELGWTIAANATSSDDLAHSDPQGRRLTPDSLLGAPERIAIFGAERVHGEGVPDDETWPALLARQLEQEGRAAEVVNFAVPGYGHDQMLLRWRREAAAFDPTIVLIGVSGEHNERDANLFPILLEREASWPFAKPRFQREGKQLALLGVPVPTPGEVPARLSALAHDPLAIHEVFFDHAASEAPPIEFSRILSYVWTRIAPLDPPLRAEFYGTGSAALSLRLVRTLAEEAERHGARVHIIHLPTPGRGPDRQYDLFRARLESSRGLHVLRPVLDSSSGAYGLRENLKVAQTVTQGL